MTDFAPNISIRCINSGTTISVPGGITPAGILRQGLVTLPFTPLCVHLDNTSQSLDLPLYSDHTLQFLGHDSATGQRVYTRSLCMLLYCAVAHTLPGTQLLIEHSVSRGHFCRVEGTELTTEKISRLREEMQRLVDADLPLKRHRGLTAEALTHFEAQGLTHKVDLLRSLRKLYTTYYCLDGVYDSYYGPLVPRTGLLKTFDLIPYEDGMLLLGYDSTEPAVTASPVTQHKMFQAYKQYLDFNHIIGVSYAGELNHAIENGHAQDIINVAEALHEKYIARISDEITRRYHQGGARLVLIAGPSSSGKTTTTKRLAVQLMTNLLKPQMISLDDYFVDRKHTPRDADGDYDYESLYALDLEQFNNDLNRILAGEEVELPTYSFEKGCRVYKGNRLRLKEGGILLIEGIHGLNPELTAHIPEDMKFRVYVSALTTLSIDNHNWIPTTDTRLLRRIIRDFKYRGNSAEETLRRWASVRRGEEKWIFPYQENADATFNSSSIFEPAVMKQEAETILSRVPQDVQEYAEACRLMKFLSYFTPVDPRMLPGTSLLREFLGGSSFKY